MYLLEQKKNESKILNDEQDNNLLLKENENEKNENKTISEKNNDNNDSQDLNNTEFDTSNIFNICHICLKVV